MKLFNPEITDLTELCTLLRGFKVLAELVLGDVDSFVPELVLGNADSSRPPLHTFLTAVDHLSSLRRVVLCGEWKINGLLVLSNTWDYHLRESGVDRQRLGYKYEWDEDEDKDEDEDHGAHNDLSVEDYLLDDERYKSHYSLPMVHRISTTPWRIL